VPNRETAWLSDGRARVKVVLVSLLAAQR
jgi:hypothetical protein